uniref:Uncharacterized protein n=1 Tax=Acrobeloides nanus TaxID=290746 RepID=A0A914DAF2_9BILA
SSYYPVHRLPFERPYCSHEAFQNSFLCAVEENIDIASRAVYSCHGIFFCKPDVIYATVFA